MGRRKQKRVVKITTQENPKKSEVLKPTATANNHKNVGDDELADSKMIGQIENKNITFNKSVKYKSPPPNDLGDTDSEVEPSENVKEIDWKYSFTTTSQIQEEESFKTHCTIRSVLQSDNFSFSFNSLTLFPDHFTINLQRLEEAGTEVLTREQILNQLSDDILATIHSSLKDQIERKSNQMDSIYKAASSVYSYVSRKKQNNANESNDSKPTEKLADQTDETKVSPAPPEEITNEVKAHPKEDLSVSNGVYEEVNNNASVADNVVVCQLKAAAEDSSASHTDPFPLYLHAIKSFQTQKFIGIKSFMFQIEELYKSVLNYLKQNLPSDVETFTSQANPEIQKVQKTRAEQIQEEIQMLLKESAEEFWNTFLLSLIYIGCKTCEEVEKLFENTLTKVLKKSWKEYAIACNEFKKLVTEELMKKLDAPKSEILKFWKTNEPNSLGLKLVPETGIEKSGTNINIILFGETEKIIWHWINLFYNYLKNSSSIKSLDALDLEMILAPGKKDVSLQTKPLEFTIRTRPNNLATTYRFFIAPSLDTKKVSLRNIQAFQIQDYLSSLSELEVIHGVCILLQSETKFSFGHEYYLHQIVKNLPKAGQVGSIHLCMTSIGIKNAGHLKDQKFIRTIKNLSHMLPGFDRRIQVLTFDLLTLPRFIVEHNHLPFDQVIEKGNHILWNNSALLGESLGSAWSSYNQPYSRYSNIRGLNMAQKIVRSIILAQDEIQQNIRNVSLEQRQDLIGADALVKKICRELCYFVYKSSLTGGTSLELELRYLEYLDYNGADKETIRKIKRVFELETKEMEESKKSNVLLLKIDSLENKKSELFGIQYLGKIIEQYYVENN